MYEPILRVEILDKKTAYCREAELLLGSFRPPTLVHVLSTTCLFHFFAQLCLKLISKTVGERICPG